MKIGKTTILSLGFIAWVTSATLAQAPVEDVEIWIKAFIPNKHDSVPDYVKPVPNKPGRTMISGPIPGVSDCFATDDRWFSQEVNASARMTSRAKLDLSGSGVSITLQDHPPGTSVEYDCEDGDEECRKPVDVSRVAFGTPTRDGTVVSLPISGEANNACFSGSPDIFYNGAFTIDLKARTIGFSGTIGRFPAFEAYASVDGSTPKPLFQMPPVEGSTVWDVPKSRNVSSPPVKFP